MSKHGKARKGIFLCLLALFLVLALPGTAFAVSSSASHVISPGNMREWNDGVKVSKTYSGTGADYRLSALLDTSGLKSGYYSAYLYDLTSHNIRAYDGISFYFKNENSTAINLNLTFVISAEKSVSLTDASFAILESADQSIIECTVPSFGTISIPAGFEGSVYIPFSSLYAADGSSAALTRIQSWGITIAMAQDQQLRFQLGNIAFLKESLASAKENYRLFSITGDSSITVPAVGSALVYFQAQAKDLDGNPLAALPSFYLQEATPGVTLSKEGVLEVDNSCEAADVTICAKLPDSINFAQTVVMLHRAGLESASGVPAPVDVEKMTLPIYAWLNGAARWVRMAAAAIALVFVIHFGRWLNESSLNYRKIHEKLYYNGQGGKKQQ